MVSESVLRRIIRDCFWDYRLTPDDILAMAEQGSEREKFFFFAKILENSTDVMKSLRIFRTEDQENMIHKYKPPLFNHYFLSRRHKVVKYLLTGEEVDIPALQWNV